MAWQDFTLKGPLPEPGAISDPLLNDLLSKPWRKQNIYTELRAGPAKLAYPLSEFPYFGHRLQAMQDFVSTQAPNSLWSLWRDHRDINRLWTIRAAVIFGFGATFLGIVQIVVGVLQIVLS